jgi:hypothetical protein
MSRHCVSLSELKIPRSATMLHVRYPAMLSNAQMYLRDFHNLPSSLALSGLASPLKYTTMTGLSVARGALPGDLRLRWQEAAVAGPHACRRYVYTVVAKPLALYTELPGRTSPYQTADVRPQVDGMVLKRQFREGSAVKAVRAPVSDRPGGLPGAV